jgi:glucose/arabinose dehydrogenase
MTRSALLLLFLLSTACGASQPASPPAAAGSPVETEAANTKLRPAFAGQTRAPSMSANVVFDVQEVTTALDRPWSLEVLPDNRILVTEKGGALRFVGRDGVVSAPGTGLPRVLDEGQGGLLDVALDPDFATNRTIYWTYSEPRQGGNGTAVARGRLAEGARPDVTGVQVIFRMMPTYDSQLHFGSRIAFAPDGTMFVSLGERSDKESRVRARDLDTHFGKVVRINRDGSIPADNPFAGRAGALPGIWTIGHRNPQGIAFRDDGSLWVIEHGPRGGDELNRIEKGRDYGWPTVTYGIEYGGETIGGGLSAEAGTEQPAYYWDPVIAPSSLLYYSGDMFREWKGSFFAAGLSGKVARITMQGDRVAGEEWLLRDREERNRDIRQGPDGAIWIVTDEGKLLRIARRG